MILGLMKTIGFSGSLFVETSITKTRTFSPICGAASPTPFLHTLCLTNLEQVQLFSLILCELLLMVP